MTRQAALCFSYEEALSADVIALGGRKKVAARLWPGEDEDTASNRMKACLAPGHRQSFSYSELMKLKEWARDVGSYATVTYESQMLHFRFEWTAPEDERDRLQRQFIEAVEKLARIKADLSQTDARLRSVR